MVGPGNEFFNLAQSSSVHTDSIQLYGASDTTITGNYIHDAAEGIMAPDGGDSGFLHIENNVFSRIDQQGVYLGFKPGLVLNHNTFSAGVMLHDDPTKGGSPTVGAVIKNNILLNGVAKQNLMANAIAVEDYNLLAGGSGAHDIKAGKPTFAAGAAPTTFAGWLLAPGQHRGQGRRRRRRHGDHPRSRGQGAGAGRARDRRRRTMRRGGAPAISIKRPTAGLAVQQHAQGRRRRPRTTTASTASASGSTTTGSGPIARRPTRCGPASPRARASARTP